MNNTLIVEKHKDMNENFDFEQEYYSGTAIGIYKSGYDSIRLMKCLAYYDRSYFLDIIYFDLLDSILKYLKEIFER